MEKMIKKKCFEKNWIIQKHKELRADPILVEKAIYAFELLGRIVLQKIFIYGVRLLDYFNKYTISISYYYG